MRGREEHLEGRLEPLTGQDASFLYMETDGVHMHTLKVAILDPSRSEHAIDFESFSRVLEKKLAELPVYRQQPIEIPLGLGHPVWATDPHFDIARHLYLRHCPAPGGEQELDAVVSEIAGRALPKDRPLWEITMVDGLAGGRVAFVCKIHHCMADGLAALEMLMHVSRPALSEPRTDVPLPVSRPGRMALLRTGALSLLSRTRDFPRLIADTVRGLYALLLRRLRHADVHAPAPYASPKTAFSGTLSPARRVIRTHMPMSELVRLKRALGVTLNDLFLALCGSALRRYLEEEGTLPKAPLIASIPVGSRPDLVGRMRGNHVGHIAASLCTHIADPVERARTIAEIVREAKQRQALVGYDLLERWFEYIPPGPYRLFSRILSQRRVADWAPTPINLIVSNVPGPREPLVVGGIPIEAVYSVGPILDGVGLNFTAWSYADQLDIIALACPQQIPDLERMVEALTAALDELSALFPPQAEADDLNAAAPAARTAATSAAPGGSGAARSAGSGSDSASPQPGRSASAASAR